MLSLRFCALDRTIALDCSVDELTEAFTAICATYRETSATADVRYTVVCGESFELWRDGCLLSSSAAAIDLAAAFELDLYEQLIAPLTGQWVLHAGAFAIGENAVVVAGESGAGKSTITLAMLARGARYLSDEAALLDAVGGGSEEAPTVRGLPRPIGFSAATLPKVLPDCVRRLGYAIRLADERHAYHTLLHPRADAIEYRPLPLGTVVLLRPSSVSTAARLVRYSKADALTALWRHSINPPNAASFAVAAHVCARTPVFYLESGGVDDACAVLEKLAKSPSTVSADCLAETGV